MTKEKIDGERVVFHGSVKPNLKTIIPNKCKHNEAYVYVSENLPICIVFAVKRTGENIAFGLNKWGKPYIDEFYDGAFWDRFKDKKCYIYKLPKDKFYTGTNDSIELVSKEPVKVLDCLVVEDSATVLLEYEKKHQIKIGWYKNFSKKKKAEMQSKLIKALSQYAHFKELSANELKELKKNDAHLYMQYLTKKTRRDNCVKKFPDLMEQIENQ